MMPAPKVAGRSRPQDVDRRVGARMRERRIMLGLTQQQMADLIGVTYQQAHKYEKGYQPCGRRPAVQHCPSAGS
jgi:DNA-binding XRE family transcriptional regulator